LKLCFRVDFKASINELEKEYHWIGKFPPSSPERKVFHNATQMGEKETRFYADFLPKLNHFIKDSGLENEVTFNFPSCPHAELTSEDFYFFMENLKECGYAVEFDKKLGLDAQHTRVVLDELAKFHATTHAYVIGKAKESSLPQVNASVDRYHASALTFVFGISA
jgi:hypothetical protein